MDSGLINQPSRGGQSGATSQGDRPIEFAPTADFTPTTRKTEEGRPILRNKDGSISTEIGWTVPDPLRPGRYVTIPTIYGGKVVSDNDAIKIYTENKGVDRETGRALEHFKSMDEAKRHSDARSAGIGDKYWYPLADGQPSAPESGSPQWEAEHKARRVPTGNFQEIDKRLGGQFGKGNIDLNGQGVYVWPSGDYSSLESITIESDGKPTLIPTIRQDGTRMTPQEAVKEYNQTGKHLGRFDSEEEASAYAIELERRQQAFYEAGPGKAALAAGRKIAEANKGANGDEAGGMLNAVTLK